MCYNYDRENVRGGINMLNYRKIEPADDKALAELIRANLEYCHLDIAGTVYFDPELDHMSGFYNADPQKRVYFTARDEAGNVIGGVQKPVSRNAHKFGGGDKAVRAGGFSADREAGVGSTRRDGQVLFEGALS